MPSPASRTKWKALRPQFEELLYTWPLRESEDRLDDSRQAPSPETPDWQERYEARYGVGDRETRKRVLDETLEMLAMSDADPERILIVLQRVRATASAERTSWVRVRLEAQFRKQATRIRESLRAATTAFLELHPEPERTEKNQMKAAAKVILRGLDTYLLLNPPTPAKSGAGKAGHQLEPYLKEARRGLKAAGVKQMGNQTNLFVAIGLLPVSNISRPDVGRG